jgi:hypothetical protein
MRVLLWPLHAYVRAAIKIACVVSVLHAQLEEKSIRIVLAKDKKYNRSDRI